MNIADLRQEYMRETLDERDAAADPITQFHKWFDEAVQAQMPLVNAMTLATVGAGGRPSARIVLLKGADASGFVFYTDYESRKGRELALNAHAALLFHWTELEREVRIEGSVTRTTPEESDAYFASRPLGSRHAAHASQQSTVVPDRAFLERRFALAAREYGESPARPERWGGYRVIPQSVEFWQGRANRLHDRLLYRRVEGRWRIERLSP
jgi:pyridoxamine 5'-phosphate oxidase